MRRINPADALALVGAPLDPEGESWRVVNEEGATVAALPSLRAALAYVAHETGLAIVGPDGERVE